jgi:hypothetical protein
MNKLYIALLSLICCTQQTHSMELGTPSSEFNDCGYQVITKPLKDRPKCPISKEYNALSEELYKENITELDILELHSKGAELNYTSQVTLHPVANYFAFNGTEQGVKNMRTIISLGAALHNLGKGGHVPLDIAVQYNSTDMIALLMQHEEPIVTIYEDKVYYEDGSVKEIRYDYSERELREYIIYTLFAHENTPMIELLLKLKLMTAQRGLKEFYSNMKPNEKIFNLLIEHGADNTSDTITRIILNKITSMKQETRQAQFNLEKTINNFETLASMLSFKSQK